MTERNYPVAEVLNDLVSSHSLYVWIKRYSQPVEAQQQDDSSQQAEIRRLRLNCVASPMSDILKCMVWIKFEVLVVLRQCIRPICERFSGSGLDGIRTSSS